MHLFQSFHHRTGDSVTKVQAITEGEIKRENVSKENKIKGVQEGRRSQLV